MAEVELTDWQEVAAKALALICLNLNGIDASSMGERAALLMNLGLQRKDAAGLLGTTDDSLRHVLKPKPSKVRASVKATGRGGTRGR